MFRTLTRFRTILNGMDDKYASRQSVRRVYTRLGHNRIIRSDPHIPEYLSMSPLLNVANPLVRDCSNISIAIQSWFEEPSGQARLTEGQEGQARGVPIIVVDDSNAQQSKLQGGLGKPRLTLSVT
jgi:hypothetical protein